MADKKISALASATTPLAGTEVLPIVQSSTTVKVAVSDLTAGRAVSTGPLTASVTDTSFAGDFQQSTAGNNAELRVYNSNNSNANSNARIRMQVGGTSAGDACLYFYDGVNTSFGPDNSDSHIVKLTTGSTPSNGTTLLATNPTTGDHTISIGNLIQGTAAKGINFTANSAASGMTSQLLNWYEEGTATLTATGMTTSPTGTVYYTRNGRMVTLDLPTITGTSNATSFTLTGLPTPVKPTNAKRVVVQVNDNGGNVVYGMADIGTGGTITLYLTPQGNLFTASGTKGIYFCSVAYSLA